MFIFKVRRVVTGRNHFVEVQRGTLYILRNVLLILKIVLARVDFFLPEIATSMNSVLRRNHSAGIPHN